jgi:hypothetical protein
VPRTTPLLGIKRSDGSWVVAGSAGGDSVEPLWSLNARAAAANPAAICSLEFAGETWPVTVSLLEDENERSANYALLIGKWPFFRAYAERAGRLIPVFLLTPKI